MKALRDQDHYEVLDVPPTADADRIERAYRLACAIYADQSLACYSIYDERESEALRDRIETAYKVLRDDEARAAYDRATGVLGKQTAQAPPDAALAHAAEATGEGWREVPLTAAVSNATPPGASESFRELEADVEEADGVIDGGSLRRARLRRGIELETIADITKVSIGNLRNIEDERFEDLPATVYVRGFLKAYATTIGLDPGRVASSYIERFEREREQQNRPRFLGRS